MSGKFELGLMKNSRTSLCNNFVFRHPKPHRSQRNQLIFFTFNLPIPVLKVLVIFNAIS